MPYASHSMRIEIEWGQCDPAGIVFNPRFFELFDAGTWKLFETVLGIPRGEINDHFGIVGLALAGSGASFKAPLKFGDAAELVSTIGEFRRSSFDVRHQILKDGALAVEGLETRVWATTHADDPLRLRALPVPADVVERFRLSASK